MEESRKLQTFCEKKAELIASQQPPPLLKPTLEPKSEGTIVIDRDQFSWYFNIPQFSPNPQSAYVGCCVLSRVIAVSELGLLLVMERIFYEYGNIVLQGPLTGESACLQTLCHIEELGVRRHHRPSYLSTFKEGDQVLALVTRVSQSEKKVLVSMDSSRLQRAHACYANYPLGKYKESLPVALTLSHPFSNPKSTELLRDHFGLSLSTSLTSVLQTKYPKEDYSISLRAAQNQELSVAEVQQGVSKQQEGRAEDALSHYERALGYWPANTDALVARGSAYSKLSRYAEACEDFRRALRDDPHHPNAQLYLLRTILAHARHLDSNNNLADAVGILEGGISLARAAIFDLSPSEHPLHQRVSNFEGLEKELEAELRRIQVYPGLGFGA